MLPMVRLGCGTCSRVSHVFITHSDDFTQLRYNLHVSGEQREDCAGDRSYESVDSYRAVRIEGVAVNNVVP